MGNVFTLDSLREEVEKEFAPVEITVSDGTTVVLRNLLRLPKKQREAALAKLKELEAAEESEDDTDKFGTLADIAAEILALVADDARQLVKDIEGDVGLTMKVLSVWMGSSQPGEAQPSPAS